MNDAILELKNRTDEIINRGWVQSYCNGTSSVGLTFEKMLGKEIDRFELPDFKGIEIKTKLIGSSSCITLFSATPDSYLFETKRLHSIYGYPDKSNINFKMFNISVVSNFKKRVSGKYFFQIHVNWNDKKVYLHIYNKNNELIDNFSAWSFELLEEKVVRKLSYLAMVSAIKSNKDSISYYKYLDINFYKLKNFQTFIKLIDEGIIRITFKVGTIKSGPKVGKICDHGTSFDIKQEDLELLFNKL